MSRRLLTTALAVLGWIGLGLSVITLRIGRLPQPLENNIGPAVAFLLGWYLTGVILTATDVLRRKGRVDQTVWWIVVVLWALSLAWVLIDVTPWRDQWERSSVGQLLFGETIATALVVPPLYTLLLTAWDSLLRGHRPPGRGGVRGRRQLQRCGST